MKRVNLETKTGKLFTALVAGEAVTAAQAKKRFGIQNISAEVSRLRQSGYPIYTHTRKAKNNVEVTEYVIGRASRRLVAAGYKAIALGIA